MTWHPASNGAGKRHWFLVNEEGEVHESARRWPIWWASMEAAQKVADRLNEAEAEADWERRNMIDIDPKWYAE
jgi:hypothetical protein